ncbi:MAG TPA: TonB-dependent receptor [Oculatellaceae cyanobacterium]|jgi:iron complex outermembrane receptor protein
MNGKSYSALIASLLALSLGVCQAEELTSDAIALEPIELEPLTVEERVILAPLTQPSVSEQAKTLRAVPGGVNLINAEQYTAGRAANLQDMLQNQPGIYIESRSGTDQVKMSIRGSGLDRTYNVRGIKLMQDGIPMSQGDGDGDFQWIEPFAQQNVEVYRGGNALQYGAGMLGGAINFISPTGYTAPGLKVRVETGSYGYIKGQISSGHTFGKLDYYASTTAYYRNGFQDHSRTSAQRYNLNVGYRFNENLETRFYGGFVNSRLQLPGTLSRDDLLFDGRASNPNAIPYNQQRNGQYAYLANKTTYRLDENQQFDITLYSTYRHLYHPLFWNPFFLNGLGILNLTANNFGSTLRYTNTHSLFGQKNQFVLGVNPNFSIARDRRYENRFSHRGRMTANGTQFYGNFDIYAENQHYFLKRLALVTGFQASTALRNYKDRFHHNPNGDQSQSNTYFGFNPKVGLVYHLKPDTQIFANYSRSFEPPTAGELVRTGGIRGNILTSKLKAQTANTLEFGFRGTFKRVAWDTTYYHSRIRNELLTLNDALGNPLGTVNANPTRHSGIESGVSVVLAEGIFSRKERTQDSSPPLAEIGIGLSPEVRGKDRLILRQVFNWSRFRFADDPIYGNNQLPGIPSHLYRGELIYEHPCGFFLQPNATWAMRKYPVDYANTLNAPPYLALGVRTGYRSRHGWSAFVEFRNLLDQRYASAVEVIANAKGGAGSPTVFVPAERFSVYGGIELKR